MRDAARGLRGLSSLKGWVTRTALRAESAATSRAKLEAPLFNLPGPRLSNQIDKLILSF